MAPLVRFAIILRQAGRGVLAFLSPLVLGAVVVVGVMAPLTLTYFLLATGVAVALFARALWRRLKTPSGAAGDAEIGMLGVVIAFLVVTRLDEELGGDAYALVFVALAMVGAFLRQTASILTFVYAALLELAVRHFALGNASLVSALPHLGFMMVFTGLNVVGLRVELSRLRASSEVRVRQDLERAKDDARNYRLLAVPRSGAGEEERLVRGGVEEIHQSVLFALRLVREALGLHTAMLLWENDAGTHLRISELSTDAPDIFEGPYAIGDGIFGAAVSSGKPVNLSALRSNLKLPHYGDECPVGAVCVVPVFEHGKMRGMLVADRIDDRAFSNAEVAMLEEASRYAVRVIHNERVFLQLERAKVEQGKLYRASEALSSAKTESEVIEAGVRSAREITSVDYAALTLFDPTARQHEVRAVSGDFDGTEADITGLKFRQNGGLVSMALENRHPLPYRGVYDEKRQIVFTRHIAPPSMPSILVLPLVAHERPLGTLVLGSRRRGAFGDSALRTLEVLASHMAISLEGARMVRRLEELATTDGLTGLLNKRAMLDVAEQKIAAAKRFSRQLAILVTDIDHFKKVNDTYGHDVGDIIIKGLGDILRRAKRTTDAVARFGGEEFVLICEETDEHGAMLLAERVRTELSKTTFTTPDGQSVNVNCSIGLATFPRSGNSWETLFKAADTALYASKQGGRNRTTVFGGASKTVAA